MTLEYREFYPLGESIEWLRRLFAVIGASTGRMKVILNALDSVDASRMQLEQTQRDLRQWKDACEVQREYGCEQTRKVAALQGDIAQRDREIEELRKVVQRYSERAMHQMYVLLDPAKPPAMTQKEMETALKRRPDDVVLVLTTGEAQQIRSLLGSHMSFETLDCKTELRGVYDNLRAHTEGGSPWRRDSREHFLVLEPKE